MKIRSVTATAVRVPVTRTGTMARAKRTHAARTIVEIVTEGGLTGVGETRGEWAAAIVRDRFAPRLVGIDAADRNAARAACLVRHIDYGFPEQRVDLYAFAAVELALWDILGKALGAPLYRLLGGAVRERAPFVAYAYTVDLDEGYTEAQVPKMMAGIAAREVAASGARMFEFKVGVHSVACEIATVNAVRDAVGPEVELAVDANMGFGMEDARRFLDGVAEARLANFEEPVARLSDMALLRSDFGVPVSSHCTDLDALKAYPEIDSVVSDPLLLGGIDGTGELMTAAVADGRRFWLRSAWELGVAWAAMCHMGLAWAPLDRPAQTLINWVADDLVEGEPWLVRNGGVRPPDAPGLGVELDRAALKRYAVG